MPRLLFLIAVLGGFISSDFQPSTQTGKDMFGLFKKQDPIEQFWKWFQATEKDLRNFQNDPDKILNQVLEHAKKIRNGLAIEFEPPKNGVVNVTVSADGNIHLFPIVKEIVEKAPKMDGWSFVAFRQRLPADQVRGMVLKGEDHELDPDKMKFFPVISGDSLDIIVYADNISEKNFNQVAYGGLLLIDNILGEYDCVTKVRNYDFQNMPTKKEELDDLKPLLGLAAYVDDFHKALHN